MKAWMHREPARPINGFTLVELLTVLVILAVMVAVTVPYASRSNEHLLLEGESRSMAETIAYAVDLAERTRRHVKLVVNPAERTYRLELAGDRAASEYAVVEEGRRAVCYMSEKILVLDLQGFELSDKTCYSLVFSPCEPWPSATVSLAVGDTIRRIVVAGRQVSVERPLE
jgi:prepilin-type N-terminal cleavage/methylation domain-containing protein